MKRTISAFLLASAYISPAFSEYSFYPFPHYAPESAVYITVGGGVSGIENSDFYRYDSSGPTEVGQPSTKDNVVGAVNAAIGYQFHSVPIRTEVAYRWFDTVDYDWDQQYPSFPQISSKATIESQAVLFNLYYDFYNTTRLTPFIGAGIGYYNNRSGYSFTDNLLPEKSSTSTAYNTDKGFAWGASIGLKYEITVNWLIDIRADYLYLGSSQQFRNNPDNPDFGELSGRQSQMKTNHLNAVSGLLNITYAYNLS